MSKPNGPWPHGQPTRTCPTCGGSGARPGAIVARMRSRDQSATTVEDLKCRVCIGRGRVLAMKGDPEATA